MSGNESKQSPTAGDKTLEWYEKPVGSVSTLEKNYNKPVLVKMVIALDGVIKNMRFQLVNAANRLDQEDVPEADRIQTTSQNIKEYLAGLKSPYENFKVKNLIETPPKKKETAAGTSGNGTGKQARPVVQPDTPRESHSDEESDEIDGDTDNGKPVRLDSNTPCFDGKGNINDWLFAINLSFQAAKVPDKLKFSTIGPYIKGLAFQTLKNYTTEKKEDASWEEFTEILIKNFHPANYQKKLRLQLKELKQGDSLDRYVTRFRTIVGQIDGMTDSDKILWFQEGLNPQTKYEVDKFETQTKGLGGSPSLEEIIQAAIQYETCMGKGMIGVNYAGKQKFFKKNHGKGNSFRANQNVQNRPNQNQNSQVVCFRCNKKGHMKKTCRVRLDNNNIGQNGNNRTSTNNSSPKKEQGNYQGNNSYRGPQNSSGYKQSRPKTTAVCHSPGDSILAVMGHLKGVDTKFSLDIGAEQSILSARVVKDIGIKVYPCITQVKTATNQVSNVIGMSDPLLVDIQGHACEICFLILDMEDHDVLLGLDWFEETGAGVYPLEKLLRFPGHTIKLSEVAEEIIDESLYGFEENVVDILLAEIADEDDIDEQGWEMQSVFSLKPEALLSKDQRAQFNKLRPIVKEMVATDFNDLGCSKLRDYRIELLDDSPIFIPPYRKSIAEREEIKLEIDKMLKAGIIRPSRSPWSSPVIMVPKKGGTKRMCIDFRKLNAVTRTINWPLPVILDILDRLSESCWFSALDLKSGYWQMKMNKYSIEKTAFSTPDGHYEFLRLPFGLKNAPAEFSRLMYMVLGQLPYVEIYLDDITIHSKSFEDHIVHVKDVLRRLKEAGLKINAEKCKWFAAEINILGHIVANHKVSMDKSKLEAIKNRQPPKNVKQLQQFLGLCNYYRRFIEGFAKIATPLFRLLQKESKWIWDKDCVNAFEALKNKLVSDPVLRLPSFNRSFILYTDASGYALGAILSQKDDEGNDYVCSYASRLLKNAELNYGITEKECLAVVWAIKHFRVYLYGTPFKVITDHSALAWLMSIKDPNARLARWAIYLQTYQFEIIHRKGKIHSNVDALSRPVLAVAVNPSSEDSDESSKSLDPWDDELLLHYLSHAKFLPGATRSSIKRVTNRAPHFKLDKDKLFYRKNIKQDKYLEWPKKS